MQGAGLPKDIQGQWIWSDVPSTDVESYVFFRRDFTLSETPSAAEFWITAGTLYHLYVNGRHLSYGPSPSVGNQIYVSYFDIGFCLEIGVNVIAVVAHNTHIARGTHTRRENGFFCQLNIDGVPNLWTDDSWLMQAGRCYKKNQPRLSSTTGFVESLDFRKYPHRWAEVDYEPVGKWTGVENVRPINKDTEVFIPSLNIDGISEKIPFDNLIYTGAVVQDKVTTHVSVSGAIKNARGLYVAETYVNQPDTVEDLALYLFSDDPYMLFVNDRLVKKQGKFQHSDWDDPLWNRPRCYRQDEIADVEEKFSFDQGWNRIVLYQQVGRNSAGATLVFPELTEGDIKFLKNMSSFGLPGWNIAGPLSQPLFTINGAISLEGLPQSTYYAIHPCDEAAHLLACSFEVGEQFEEPLDYIELKEGEYAIIEIEKYVRGCLDMYISGSAGDTLDIVYGEYLQGNVVSPYIKGLRRIFTLTLDDGDVNWQAIAPQGMSCLMIIVRHAAASIVFRDIGIRVSSTGLKDQNSFSCSDELLNHLWEIGVGTLNGTYDYNFVNAGCNVEGQVLGHAMIQGITSFFVHGDRRLSEKALREFAAGQFATGEIPAVVPGDLLVRYLDFALLWPVWLQQHVMNTGDKQILEDLQPNLDRLLGFFKRLASDETELIGDPDSAEELPCFIDYDTTIEKKGVSTALNALYCFSLLKSEWLYNFIDKPEEASKCNGRASRIAENIQKLTWNEKEGLFADCWYNGKPSEVYSLQTNALALYAGVAMPDQVEKVFSKLFFDYAPYQETITDKVNENPYFKYFLLDMAFNLDLRDWGVEYMRYYWGKMVQGGAFTWWNKFSPDLDFTEEQATSSCHGYGVSPNYFLMREVVGVRPVDPGFGRVYFNPLLTACEWTKAKIHTHQGGIKIEWSHLETGELEIRIDADFPLEVVPQLDPTIAANAILHISDDVTIIE